MLVAVMLGSTAAAAEQRERRRDDQHDLVLRRLDEPRVIRDGELADASQYREAENSRRAGRGASPGMT